MRILIAVHGYPPTHSAGAERQAERMAQWLHKHGHHIEVFALESVSTPGFKVESSEQDGITIHRVSYSASDGADSFRVRYDYAPLGDAIRKIMTERQFDLLHIISGYWLGGQAIHTAKALGIPVVVSPMEYWFMCTQLNLIKPTGELCIGPESDQKCMRCIMEEKRRFRRPAEVAPVIMDTFWSVAKWMPFAQPTTQAVAERRHYLRAALDTADLVICNSRFLINKFQSFGFDTRNYHYIRQGLTTQTDQKPAVTTQLGTLRLGYIGQIKHHKGVDILVDAAIKLLDEGKNISLDLWGNETEVPEYTRMLKERSANYPAIRWNGPYVGAKVWDVIGSIDVLVVPSRWYENSPNVILEAFEMRRPVIVTNLGGMAELVENGKSGLVFELNNTADLARQIERMASESGLLEQLRAGIPTVKRIDDEMHEVVQQYERLLSVASPSRS